MIKYGNTEIVHHGTKKPSKRRCHVCVYNMKRPTSLSAHRKGQCTHKLLKDNPSPRHRVQGCAYFERRKGARYE